MSAKSENMRRCAKAAQALTLYDLGRSPRESLVDLLSDLRHWCDGRGFDFAAADRMAYQHYREELGAALLQVRT